MIRRKFARVSVLAAVAASFSVVSLSTPASAYCASSLAWYATTASNSAVLSANSGCDGMWANAANTPDYVRGQYKDGTWTTSTYGWQYIGTGSKKVIGNTVPGRLLRGQGQYYSQHVNTTY